MAFLHSHLDETYLGLGEDPQTSASAAEAAAPAPESYPVAPLPDSSVILGMTKRQILTILILAAGVIWYMTRNRNRR